MTPQPPPVLDLPEMRSRLRFGDGTPLEDEYRASAISIGELRALLDRLEAAEAELAKRKHKPTCSCGDVFGEDPNCFKHGRGSEWAKANPDICALVDRAEASEARLALVEGAARPFTEAVELLDADTPPDMLADDDMSTEDAFFVHQQPTVGDFRRLYRALSPSNPDTMEAKP